jgi:hypothetical protein
VDADCTTLAIRAATDHEQVDGAQFRFRQPAHLDEEGVGSTCIRRGGTVD